MICFCPFDGLLPSSLFIFIGLLDDSHHSGPGQVVILDNIIIYFTIISKLELSLPDGDNFFEL